MHFPFSKQPQRLYEIDDAVLTLTEKDAARLEWPLWRGGSHWLLLGGMAVIVLFMGRLVYLNFLKGEEYRSMAERNSLRALVQTAPRGIIFDQFGEALVQNDPSFDAVLIPSDLPRDAAERSAVLEAAHALFQPDETMWQSLVETVPPTGFQPMLVAAHITDEQVVRFLSDVRRFPGISLTKSIERSYKDGPIFSPVIGYEGKIQPSEYADRQSDGYLLTDTIGKQGIEKSYETALRGVHGKELVEVDAAGRIQKNLGVIPPQKGKDLILSLDAEFQRVAYATLERVLHDVKLKRGAVIALDPRSGAVRALVSYPSFDNNLFSGGIGTEAYRSLLENPDKPLFNRAIAGVYPPGSTIKPLLAGAALAEGIITPETSIESRGGIQVGRFFFGDWKAHGFTDLRRAIAVSSDVYFYSIGGGYGAVRGLGMEKMKWYEERFGWGKETGIDIPGEAAGFLPTPEWKKRRLNESWYVGDDYNASIGQGFVTTTPLQIVNAITAIANGGTLFQPRVVDRIREFDGRETVVKPEIAASAVLDPMILRVVREGMRETVTEGTAQSLQALPVAVAGKTGTAQFGGAKQTHGWFVSFAPYENPELALIVLVEDQPEQSTYHAVPITKSLYEWYFSPERVEKRGSNKP